jgi:hypothetical protein
VGGLGVLLVDVMPQKLRKPNRNLKIRCPKIFQKEGALYKY